MDLNELKRGQRVRDKKDNTEYEFGYIGQTGWAICYIPGCCNMQDAVCLRPDRLEVMQEKWEPIQ